MSDQYSVIPQASIDTLIADPTYASSFDAVFGQGRAAEVLSRNIPEPEPEEDKDLSLAMKLWDATGQAVLRGAQEAGNETLDAYESFDMWAGRKLDELGVPSRVQFYDVNEDGSLGEWNPRFVFHRDSVGQDGFLVGNIGTTGDAPELNAVPETQTITGDVVSGISQFVAGFALAGKFTKLAGIRGAFVNGALADAIVFDPSEANITGILEDFGVNTGVLGDILATDPDDPEYINRLRNAAEGVIAGSIVEAIGWFARSRKAAKAGDVKGAKVSEEKAEEALKALDEAVAEAGQAMTDDVAETLKVANEFFPDADGQLRLDLGDTPAPRVEGASAPHPNRIYLTPEKAEKTRLQSSLARHATIAEKTRGTAYTSLTNIENYKDVLDEIAGQTAIHAEQFAKIKGGNVQRWADVRIQAGKILRQLTELTGEDPEALMSRFLSPDMSDPTQYAATVHAHGEYIITIERELKRMSAALRRGAFDPREFPGISDINHLKLAYNQRMEVALNLLAGERSMGSNMGRALNAMKMVKKGDEKLRELLQDPALFRDVDALAGAVVDNPDVPALRVIKDTRKKLHGYMDRINTFRINALLSGPGTQEVNFISNVVNSFVIPAEQGLGAAVSGDLAGLQHALRQFQGQLLGLFDAVPTALRAGWWDDAILDPFNTKIEDDALTGVVTGFKKVDNVIKLPTRALMTMDEFFKQTQYRGRVFADAHAEAAAQGLTGEAKAGFVRKYLIESYDASGKALRGDALLQAQKATFTEALEGGVASMIQMSAIKHPTIRFIIPFVRTPVNILSQTFQHIPIAGALSKRWQADFAAGGVRRAQAIGKWIIGASLMAAAGLAVSEGRITGSGPSDPRIRKVWLKNNQPYSFRVDREDGTIGWVSYARLEPLSNIFSIAADINEISKDTYNEVEVDGLLQPLVMAVMENTVNKTFTQGIYDFMTVLNGQPHAQERALNAMVSSFVPNVLNQLNGDEVLRETRSLTDMFLARTHLYNGVDPKRNVLGEPVVRTLPKYDPLGLTNKDIREVDEVMEEITRVAILNQSVADNPARRIPGPNRIDISEVPYSDTQSLYDRWVELTGEVKIGGKTLREKLAEEIASSSYQGTPDGFIGSSTGTKGARIKKIIGQYRKKAKGELPELIELIESERRGGATLLRQQKTQNRRSLELFPSTTTPSGYRRPRTFEDLLND